MESRCRIYRLALACSHTVKKGLLSRSTFAFPTRVLIPTWSLLRISDRQHPANPVWTPHRLPQPQQQRPSLRLVPSDLDPSPIHSEPQPLHRHSVQLHLPADLDKLLSANPPRPPHLHQALANPHLASLRRQRPRRHSVNRHRRSDRLALVKRATPSQPLVKPRPHLHSVKPRHRLLPLVNPRLDPPHPHLVNLPRLQLHRRSELLHSALPPRLPSRRLSDKLLLLPRHRRRLRSVDQRLVSPPNLPTLNRLDSPRLLQHSVNLPLGSLPNLRRSANLQSRLLRHSQPHLLLADSQDLAELQRLLAPDLALGDRLLVSLSLQMRPQEAAPLARAGLSSLLVHLGRRVYLVNQLHLAPSPLPPIRSEVSQILLRAQHHRPRRLLPPTLDSAWGDLDLL